MLPKTSKQLTVTTSTGKTAMAQTIVDNRMRYAKKSPEEQKSAKFSQVACLKENTCSSGTDANADLPGGDNPAAPEPKQEKKKRKSAPGNDSGRRRRRTWRTRRCGKAVKMMSKIERIRDKKRRGLNMRNIELPISFCLFFPVDSICKRKRGG